MFELDSEEIRSKRSRLSRLTWSLSPLEQGQEAGSLSVAPEGALSFRANGALM